MRGMSSDTLTELMIRDGVEDFGTPLAERELFWHYDDPRLCYRSDCWSLGQCRYGLRLAGPRMRVLERPALDWPKTWRRYEHHACLAVGHYEGIDAVETRPGRWRRGRVAVRRVDQFLRSMGRLPACCHSHIWRRRLFAYLKTDVGVAHFTRWLNSHRQRHTTEEAE